MLQYRGKGGAAAHRTNAVKFTTVKQVIHRFSNHPKVKVQKVDKGLYGIFAKGNPEWSEPEWSCMARYDRTALLEWANRFFPLSANT